MFKTYAVLDPCDAEVVEIEIVPVFERGQHPATSESGTVEVHPNESEGMVPHEDAELGQRQVLLFEAVQQHFEFRFIGLHQLLRGILTQIHHC